MKLKMIGMKDVKAARRATMSKVRSVRIHLPVKPVTKVARKTWLAGAGAVTMVWDGVESMGSRLLDRGEMVEKETRSMVRSVGRRQRKVTETAEMELDKRLGDLVARMKLPTIEAMQTMNSETRAVVEKMNKQTHAEIQALDTRITALNRRITELKKLEEPQIEQVEVIAGHVENLTGQIEELKAMEEPKAEAAKAVAGKVGTLTRKVNELQKAQDGKPMEPPKKRAAPSKN